MNINTPRVSDSNGRFKLHIDDVLFFLHIPKTAGLSLISLLDAQYPLNQIFPFHSASTPEVFQNFSPEEFAQYRLVRGHYRFGSQDREVYRNISQTPVIITVLRDPISRTVSAYNHIRKRKMITVLPGRIEIKEASSALQDFGRFLMKKQDFGEEVSRLSLEEYVCHPQFQDRVVNRQTRMIVGAVKGLPLDKKNSSSLSQEAMLTLAKERLEQFAFVGVTEMFRESLQLLTYTFGWEPVFNIPELNTGLQTNPFEGIPESTLEEIRKRTKLDAELHSYAKDLFTQRYSSMLNELLKIDYRRATGQLVDSERKDEGNIALIRIGQLKAQNARLFGELQEVKQSWGWRGMKKVSKSFSTLFPEGSFGERTYDWLISKIIKPLSRK